MKFARSLSVPGPDDIPPPPTTAPPEPPFSSAPPLGFRGKTSQQTHWVWKAQSLIQLQPNTHRLLQPIRWAIMENLSPNQWLNWWTGIIESQTVRSFVRRWGGTLIIIVVECFVKSPGGIQLLIQGPQYEQRSISLNYAILLNDIEVFTIAYGQI